MQLPELQQIIGNELQEYQPKAGVYFLLLGDEIVYVGQSFDIGARVASHRQEGKKQFDRIVFQETPDLQARLVRESHYIEACKPRHNAGMAKYEPFPHTRFDDPVPLVPCFVAEANVTGVRPEQLQQYLSKIQ